MLDIEVAMIVLFIFSPIIVAVLYKAMRGLSWFWRRQKK